MFVKSLELKNFRNYDDLSITFDKDNNILFGNNAQGKTNTLEAIYVCGTTKSHKGCKDKELIKIGENESHISMIVNKNGVPGEVGVVYLTASSDSNIEKARQQIINILKRLECA